MALWSTLVRTSCLFFHNHSVLLPILEWRSNAVKIVAFTALCLYHWKLLHSTCSYTICQPNKNCPKPSCSSRLLRKSCLLWLQQQHHNHSFSTKFYYIPIHLHNVRNPKIFHPCGGKSTYFNPHRGRFPWLLSERLHWGNVRSHLRPRSRISRLHLDEPTWKAFWSYDCWGLDLSRCSHWKSRWWKQGSLIIFSATKEILTTE